MPEIGALILNEYEKQSAWSVPHGERKAGWNAIATSLKARLTSATDTFVQEYGDTGKVENGVYGVIADRLDGDLVSLRYKATLKKKAKLIKDQSRTGSGDIHPADVYCRHVIPRIEELITDHKQLSTAENEKSKEKYLMGNNAMACALSAVRTAANGVPGLATSRSLFKLPGMKPGAVVFDKDTAEGEGKVGTGDAEMFLTGTGNVNEEGSGDEEGGADEIKPLPKKKKKSKDDKMKEVKANMAELKAGIAESHAKHDDARVKNDLQGMQKMLESVKIPLTEALGGMGQALKEAVAGRSDQEMKDTEERLTKIEDALND